MLSIHTGHSKKFHFQTILLTADRRMRNVHFLQLLFSLLTRQNLHLLRVGQFSHVLLSHVIGRGGGDELVGAIFQLEFCGWDGEGEK